MDATEVIEHDHRIFEQMFRDYEAAASAAQRMAAPVAAIYDRLRDRIQGRRRT